MNKTIIININGIIFHIEEDAYEVLQTYMTAVKRHFGYSPDSNEIVSDIENRIAEMFNERISQQKAVITMQDVDEVTAQMGHISDFEEFENEGNADERTNSEYQEQNHSDYRRLFRDPDDKLIGGVCSGLGHYFDIEAKWIRLSLVLLVLFAGTGLLLYIFLWILMPLARSRADKMSMRGEAANIHNFKKRFDEEIDDLKRNFTEAGQKMSPGLKNAAKSTYDALDGIIRIVVKVIGVMVIIAAALSLIVLSISMYLFFIEPENITFIDGFSPAHFIDPSFYTPFAWASFLVLSIPLITLILLSVKMISRLKISKYLGYTLLITWIASLGFVGYYAAITSLDHSVESSVVETESLMHKNVYQLSFNEPTTISKEYNIRTNGKGYSNKFIRRGRGSLLEIRPKIYINTLTQGKTPSITKRYSAEGRNADIAVERAQHIDYKIIQHNGRLILDNYALVQKGDLIREQEVRIELNIPVGTRLIIDKEVQHRIYNVSFDQVENNYSNKRQSPEQSEWIMTSYGLEYIPESQSRLLHGLHDSLSTLKDSTNIKIDTVLKK